MRIVVLAAILGLASSCGALAQDVAEPPEALPLWVVIVAGDEGRIVMSFPDDQANKSENYTVNVPYKGDDGQIRIRMETRVRESKVGATRIPKTIRFRMNDIQFLDLNGNQLEPPDVVKRIAKPTRMMAVTAPKIDPFFQAILKPETLVVVIPAKNLVGR